jgi:hypothetical protein
MSDRSGILLGKVGLSGHILPVSATLIGVCVTLVGLVKVVEIKIGNSRVDEYAALRRSRFQHAPLPPIFRFAARPMAS